MFTKMTVAMNLRRSLFAVCQRLLVNPVRFRAEQFPCWNCHHKNTVFCMFCEQCDRLQDPFKVVDGKLDYFDILGLPRKYDLPKKALAASFRALQAKLHPDRYATASEKEQSISSDTSSLVNRAYSVLKNPHTRGLHLLELNNMSLEDGEMTTDPEFLMEIMEINEEITDASPERLKEIYEENEKKIVEHSERLAKAFSEKNFEEARKILAEMKYFDNIAEKLEKAGVAGSS